MNKRVQAFLDKMQEKELDGIIINNLKNVYYLTGFWGIKWDCFGDRRARGPLHRFAHTIHAHATCFPLC